MIKFINIILFILSLIFFLSIYKFYSSIKNIELKNYNRNNIDKIINRKISNLPILNSDTDNVIEFSDGFSNGNNNDKPRSFWDLINFK